MLGPARPHLAPFLFGLILLNVACSAFFQLYWTRDNSWSLDPGHMQAQWISEADWRGIRATTAAEYSIGQGRTVAVPADPVARERFLAGYDFAPPDGRWRARLSSTLADHTRIAWVPLAVPVTTVGVLGLILTWPRPGKAPAPPEL